MGPGLADPQALERAGLKLADMDLIEMHEAFAAQVASNIQALESETWAREKLGRTEPVGKVDRERLNVNGGSIALGHPFGATGARITTTLANEMKRRGSALRPDLGLRPGRHGLRDGARAMSGPARSTGVRVLDLTRYIPGPYCTHAPGRPRRGRGEGRGAAAAAIPRARCRPRWATTRAAHAALNRNKRSVVVDLRTDEGAAVVRRLAARGRRAGRGLPARRARPPRPGRRAAAAPTTRGSSTARSPATASEGPHGRARRATTSTTLALGGFLGANRDADGRPVLPGAQVADMTGGARWPPSASWPPCRRASARAAASSWTSRCSTASLAS